MPSSRPEPTPQSADRPAAPPAADFWLERYTAERSTGDRLRMRLCIAAAALVHVVLFAITFPAVSESEPERDEPVVIFDLRNVAVKPPEPLPAVRQTPPQTPPEVVVPVPEILEPLIVESRPVEPPAPVVLEVPPVAVEIPAPPPPPAADLPIRFGSGMTRPVKISGPAPAYTEVARRARVTGVVILEAVIDKHGEVTDLEVLKDLPFGLTESALRAVGQWRFEPATHGGRPVAVLYNLTIKFELR